MYALYYDWNNVSSIDDYKIICQNHMEELCKMGFEHFNWVDSRLIPLDSRLYRFFLFRTAEVLNDLGFPTYFNKYKEIYSKSETQLSLLNQKIIDGYRECLVDNKNNKAIKKLEVLADYIFEMKAAGVFCTYEPKVYGLLGLRYFKAFNKKLALYYTNAALELCITTNDTVGIKVYTRNLKIVQNIFNVVFLGRIV